MSPRRSGRDQAKRLKILQFIGLETDAPDKVVEAGFSEEI